ncbi:unnamed protein product, partial [marine sediment metagenome]
MLIADRKGLSAISYQLLILNSYLITGGNHQERLAKASKVLQNGGTTELTNTPDLLLIRAHPSVQIRDIRALQKFLSLKPYQAEIKTVLIPEAEKMTIPAQNSFLKTLEEPPENSLIILCCPNKEQLLPTIISRCQLIKLPPKSEIEVNKSLITNYSLLITKILKSGAGEKLQP